MAAVPAIPHFRRRPVQMRPNPVGYQEWAWHLFVFLR